MRPKANNLSLFSIIPNEINANNGFQLFSHASLKFSLKQNCMRIELSLANLHLFTRVPTFSRFSRF